MRRRRFLAATGMTGLAATAGCFGILETEPANREPPLPENRPDAPYVPTHTEGMEMAGTAANGRYRVALSYSFPHRFWLMRDEETERVNVESGDDVHLMASVWDAESGIALPASSPQIELVDPEGETRTVTPWQMLSQRMGAHYGDNVALGADGDYEATVRVSPSGTRRTDDVTVPDGPVQFSVSFTFEVSTLDGLPYDDIPSDREGTEGAVDPMDMPPVQVGRVPPADDLPLNVRGTQSDAGATVVLGTVDERGSLATGSDETYVAASVRTEYNRFPIAATSLDVQVVRGGEAESTTTLVPALDPDVGYHYGAVVSDLSEDDDLRVRMQAAPQVTRHEGYETAFFDVDPMTF